MSTGLECEFVEPTPGVWYYILEMWDAPKNAWSWLEYADAYGPFTTLPEAEEHLRQHHANPGGSYTIPHSEFKPREVYQHLFDCAKR